MDTEQLAELARTHGVRLMLQFGSTVRGKAHAGSDVDIGVVLDCPDLSLRAYAELEHDVQRLFGDVKVDLVILNRADPLLLAQVSSCCRRLHGSDREMQEFRLRAFKRYQDHRPYLELERRWVERTLERDLPRHD